MGPGKTRVMSKEISKILKSHKSVVQTFFTFKKWDLYGVEIRL